MGTDEQDATLARLIREHKEVAEKRLFVVERVKQVSAALKKLAEAINRKPDFDEVAKDSLLHEYLDLSKIGALVIEEMELSQKQQDYETRLRQFGYEPWSGS